MSPTEARQGRKGSPVLMVLIAGIVLALLAWGAAEWWGEASDAPDQQTATPPAADNAPASSAAPQGGDTAPATPPAPPSSSNP